MNKNIQNLLQKDMTRKEFIATTSLGVASLFGFSTVIKMLTSPQSLHRSASKGYGSGYYG